MNNENQKLRSIFKFFTTEEQEHLKNRYIFPRFIWDFEIQ